MTVKEVVPGLHQFSKGGINSFLIDSGDDGLTLIDAGLPDHADMLTEGIHSIGRDVSDLTNILITHAHPDHLGSAKHFASDTAPISLHPADAGLAAAGIVHPTMKPGPGLLTGILFRLVMPKKPGKFPSFEPDIALNDGDVVDVAGGIEVIHTPGHTDGHVAFLWKRDRGLLFTGDAAANALGLNYMFGYNDVAIAKTSLVKLASHDFEAAVFGHGRPILSGASRKFAAKFG